MHDNTKVLFMCFGGKAFLALCKSFFNPGNVLQEKVKMLTGGIRINVLAFLSWSTLAINSLFMLNVFFFIFFFYDIFITETQT